MKAMNGSLPLSWRFVPLREALETIEAGKSPKAQDRPAMDGELGVLKLSAVTWNTFRPEENKALLPGFDPGDCPRVRRGDLLISRANTTELIGAVVMSEEDHSNLLLSDKTLRLVPKAGVACAHYLLHVLRTPEVRKHFERHATGTSASMRNISQENIRETWIPLPPLPEQHHIATALGKADAILRKRQRAVEETDSLIPAIFHERFGDPVANRKGSPLVPLTWYGRVTTGNTPSRDVADYYGDAIEWIKSDNINTPSHILTQASEYLSDAGKHVARLAPAGSTLVTCIAGSPACIGNAALADREVAFNQQINAITPHTETDPYFLYTLLMLSKRLVQSASTDSMKGLVSKRRFESLQVIKVPTHEQHLFGRTFVTVLGVLKKRCEARHQATELFQALVQRAFRGEL